MSVSPPENLVDVSVEEVSKWAVDRDKTALRVRIDTPVQGMVLADSLQAYSIESTCMTLKYGYAVAAYIHGPGLDRVKNEEILGRRPWRPLRRRCA